MSETNDQDKIPADSESGGSGEIDRREVLKAAGALAVGAAAAVAGQKEAVAQESIFDEQPVIGTPDWRNFEPGKRDEEGFVEMTGEPDKATSWEARSVYGVAMGIITFRQYIASVPGEAANANSYNFPVLFKEMDAESILDTFDSKVHDRHTKAAVEACKWLELQGVRGIIAGAGFWSTYQQAVQDQINVPFFSSTLLQIPALLATTPAHQKIGVFAANAENLRRAPAIENCGVSLEDKENRLVIGQPEGDGYDKYVEVKHEYWPAKLGEDLERAAVKMAEEHDISCFVLESTAFPPSAYRISRATQKPVYDTITLAHWAYSGLVRRPYTGIL